MQKYPYRSNEYIRQNQCYRSNPVPVASECDYAPVRETQNTNCCKHDPLSNLPIAMAYVPWQEFRMTYSAEKGFCRGTIFEELDKPFQGMGGCRK